jgi:hypothetical protein
MVIHLKSRVSRNCNNLDDFAKGRCGRNGYFGRTEQNNNPAMRLNGEVMKVKSRRRKILRGSGGMLLRGGLLRMRGGLLRLRGGSLHSTKGGLIRMTGKNYY